MPDALYADPRLAPLYDPLDPDRSDLDAYLAMVEEFEARSVLDVGCRDVRVSARRAWSRRGGCRTGRRVPRRRTG